MCDHTGLHTPRAFYTREQHEMRYVTVCDSCGVETREVHREPYTPKFDPSGNDEYLALAVPSS